MEDSRLIDLWKRYKRVLVVGIAAVVLVGVMTSTVLVASASAEGEMTTTHQSGHDMPAMGNSAQNSHDMPAMSNNSSNSHDMNNMKMEGHDASAPKSEDNPWPVLYGFGGAIATVILVAGILKYSRRKVQG